MDNVRKLGYFLTWLCWILFPAFMGAILSNAFNNKSLLLIGFSVSIYAVIYAEIYNKSKEAIE